MRAWIFFLAFCIAPASALFAQGDPDNLVRNAGFEDNTRSAHEPVDWTCAPPLDLGSREGASVDSRRAHAGRHALRFFPGSSREEIARRSVRADQWIRVKNLNRVFVSWWTLAASDAGPFVARLESWSGERKLLGEPQTIPAAPEAAPETWTYRSAVLDLPPGGRRLRLIFTSEGPGMRWLDDVILRPATDADRAP